MIDGGAHLGFYSLLAERALAGSGTVLAFEPDPYNFAALQRNVAATSITAVPKALSADTGRSLFQPSLSTTGSSLLPRSDIEMATPIDVETTTIDTELDGLPLDVLIVKLDVEGSELAALAGMQHSLERARTIVLFAEVNPKALASVGLSARSSFSDFESLA